MDSNLLNKIQAIKTLRDRAGTDGEKDAAQHKLMLLLAKHKLTEQDIPPTSFSTRNRYTPPRQSARRSPPTDFPRDPFNMDEWDAIFRRFREAAGASYRQQEQPRQDSRQQAPRRAKGQKNRERFEKTFGRPITNNAWYLIRYDFQRAKRLAEPSNPNAFARAYMETAAIHIRERLYQPPTRTVAKSKNFDGKMAGLNFAERVNLDAFS